VDEAGVSNKERHCVVAGVVSHPDKQWKALRLHLEDIAAEFVPEMERDKVVFHAKDIWHGTKAFHRTRWHRRKRYALLEQLAAIPVKFSLPVIAGVVEKSMHQWGGTKPGSAKWEAYNYSLAFGLCAVHFEYVLREMCSSDELGTFIAEDAPDMRRYAKWGYGLLADPKHEWPEIDETTNYMPFERVIEQPLFADKRGSPILQIADFIAFVTGRRVNGHEDVQALFDRFSSQLVILPHQR
jgi:hypothetical protein